MRILLLGLNYAPEPIGTARYTAGLVEALAARGHEVRAVVGQPYYPDWASQPGFAGWSVERLGTTEIYRVPHRIPARPSGRGRLVQQLTFALASLPRMLESAVVWRPDRVIAIAPSLLAAPIGLLAARLCGAQSWLHLQDFELEAAFATGLVARNRALMAILRRVEKRVLQSFDQVSSISPAMCRRLADTACGTLVGRHGPQAGA
jgi:colanic acid biosynthesis glycosyl transferase WcaI